MKKKIKKKPMAKVKAGIKKRAYIYTSALKPLLNAWDRHNMAELKRQLRKLKALVRQCETR